MSLLKPNSALLSGTVDFTFQISQRQITQYKSINHLNSNQEGRHVLMIKIIFLFKYQTLILPVMTGNLQRILCRPRLGRSVFQASDDS